MLSTAGITLAATKVSEDGIDLFSSSVEPGRASAFLILLSFLVTWLFIRTSARLIRMQVSWWPGNVETSSGLHIHHLVWGIVLMMISGFIAFATELSSPWWEITSVAFGIGAGLTLDEYALWLHLDDVYWSEAGRSSIDAVVVALLFAGLIVLGVRPLGLDDTGDIVATIGYGSLSLVFSLITFAKGRLFMGVLAFFIPVVGMYCACRLAKPHSIWARWRYKDTTERGRHKLERAQRRWKDDRRGKRWGTKLQDWIGGRTSDEIAAHAAATTAPAAEPAGGAAKDPAAAAGEEHTGDPAS